MTATEKLSLILAIIGFMTGVTSAWVTIFPKLKTLPQERKKIDSEQQSNIAEASVQITNAVKVLIDPLEKRILDLEGKRKAWEAEKVELEALVKKLTQELDKTKRWAERLVDFIRKHQPSAEIPPFEADPKT